MGGIPQQQQKLATFADSKTGMFRDPSFCLIIISIPNLSDYLQIVFLHQIKLQKGEILTIFFQEPFSKLSKIIKIDSQGCSFTKISDIKEQNLTASYHSSTFD